MSKIKSENQILIMLAFLVYQWDYGRILDSYGYKITVF